MNRTSKSVLFSLICAISVVSCKKEIRAPSITVANAKTQASYNNIFSTWNTATTMPVSTGAATVPMPWYSSVSPIDTYLASDHNQADGWEMVYNTFNTSTDPSSQGPGEMYFALYNRYRGLLRFYVYFCTGCVNYGSSVNIEHGLSYPSNSSATTKMLNFEGNDLVDPTLSNYAFTKTTNAGDIATGGWQVMQYQIAYDPASTSAGNVNFTWNLKTTHIDQINYNTANAGTINGDITKQYTPLPAGTASPITYNGSIVNIGQGAGEVFGVYTGSPFNNVIPYTYGGSGTVVSGIGYPTVGCFDAIYGGNSSNSQEIDMKVNSSIDVKGSLTASQPMTSKSLIFPGQSSNNTLYPSAYGSLGVFNFPNLITVHVNSVKTTAPTLWDGPSNQYYVNYISVDANWASAMQVNPALSSIATVTASYAEPLVMNFDGASSFYEYPRAPETVGNITVIKNATIDGRKLVHNDFVGGLVRVYVKVTPFDTSIPPSVIVKTFKANFINP